MAGHGNVEETGESGKAVLAQVLVDEANTKLQVGYANKSWKYVE